MTLRALYYASPILPVIIDSVVYATILIFLVSVIPMKETLLKSEEEKVLRLRRIIAAVLGIVLALVLQFSFGLNLEILLSGGLAWALILLLALIIFIPAISVLFKKKKNGDKKKINWLLWLVIIILAVFVIAMFFRTMPVGETLAKPAKEVFDYAIIIVLIALFVFLLIWLRRDELKKQKEQKSPKPKKEPEKEKDKETPEPKKDEDKEVEEAEKKEKEKKEKREKERIIEWARKINRSLNAFMISISSIKDKTLFKNQLFRLLKHLEEVSEVTSKIKIDLAQELTKLLDQCETVLVAQGNESEKADFDSAKLDTAKNDLKTFFVQKIKEIKDLIS